MGYSHDHLIPSSGPGPSCHPAGRSWPGAFGQHDLTYDAWDAWDAWDWENLIHQGQNQDQDPSPSNINKLIWYEPRSTKWLKKSGADGWEYSDLHPSANEMVSTCLCRLSDWAVPKIPSGKVLQGYTTYIYLYSSAGSIVFAILRNPINQPAMKNQIWSAHLVPDVPSGNRRGHLTRRDRPGRFCFSGFQHEKFWQSPKIILFHTVSYCLGAIFAHKIPLETWRHLPDEIWLDQQWTLGLGFCRKTRCQKPDVERPQPQTEQAVPTSLDFTCHPHTMVSCRWFTQVASSVSPKFCIVRDRWSGNCIRLLFCCKRLGS